MIIRRYMLLALGALLAALVALSGSTASNARGQASGPLVYVELEGVLTSVSVGYLRRALREAEAAQASALLVRLRGEGAVLRAVRPFAGELFEAAVPVVVYVEPNVQAGAAGAFLLSAAHIAALGPGASFGSAAPLARVDEALSQQTRDLVLDSVANQLRDWNRQRGRGTDWIDRAVREGAILNNEQASAADPPAIDLVARDWDELPVLIEGRVVELANGREAQISALGRQPQPIPPTLWEQLWMLLAIPEVAFMLLVMGAVAIYAELANPGSTVFAGVGVVLLVGAALGLAVLPIRWLSLLAVLLAFGLMGADLFVPSHGGLTVAGITLLVVGALTLIDPQQAPGVFIALWLIFLVALMVASLAAAAIYFALRSRNEPVRVGSEALIGKLAEVRQPLDPEGMVFVEGALWRAVSEDGAAAPGELVRVTGIHELRLLVRKADG
jgi:membrane-bound serine protease (ClpP class)